jgi:hypothetical protein
MGLQPEMYVSLRTDEVWSKIWDSSVEPNLPEAVCATCGRPKKRGEDSPDYCASNCPGHLDRPWPLS